MGELGPEEKTACGSVSKGSLNPCPLFPYREAMVTPTLRQLDIFAQLVASGSLADCARDLDLPVDAVDEELKALEARLGHRLFDQDRGTVRLTAAGRKTVEAMQLLSETSPESWAEQQAPLPPPAVAPSPVQPSRRQVTIAAHPAVFSHFQEALNAFEESGSDVAIALELQAHTLGRARPQLISGAVDIAYVYALEEPPAPSRYAWSEPLALYVGDSHPLAALDLVDVTALDGAASVALSPDNDLRPLIEQGLRQAGIGTGRQLLQTDNLLDILQAVRGGSGYFAAFGPLARDFARMEGVRRLPIARPLPQIALYQIVRPGGEDDPIVASLAEYLFR